MPPGLSPRSVEAHHATVVAREPLRSDGARDRRLGGNVVVVEIVERNAADDDGEQGRALAVVSEIHAFSRGGVGLVRLREAMPLVVDECAGDAEVDRAAGMDIDAPVAGGHALTRQAEARVVRLIAKAALDRADRLLDR